MLGWIKNYIPRQLRTFTVAAIMTVNPVAAFAGQDSTKISSPQILPQEQQNTNHQYSVDELIRHGFSKDQARLFIRKQHLFVDRVAPDWKSRIENHHRKIYPLSTHNILFHFKIVLIAFILSLGFLFSWIIFWKFKEITLKYIFGFLFFAFSFGIFYKTLDFQLNWE